MRQGPKPAKSKEAKPPVGRKSPRDDARVRDLEKRLAEAQEQQAATSEILNVISSSPTNVQPVFDTIVENAARLCRADDALLQRVDGAVLRIAAHVGSIPSTWAEMPIIRELVVGQAILERRTIHVHDMEEEHARGNYPASVEHRRLVGYRTLLVTPLIRENVALGAIVMRRLEVRDFTESQIDLLRTFADQAVIAIENVRLSNETKEALEQQTATAEILRVISGSPTDVQPVLDAVVRSAIRLCEGYDAWIGLTEGGNLRVRAHQGPIAVAEELRPIRRGRVSETAVVDRRTIHVHDLAASGAEFPQGHADALRIGQRTVLGVPLLREGEAIGVILIRRLEVRPFTDKQISLLQTFADQAVIAIENVRLFKELEAANRDLAAASQHKSEFLANMSHELRTPLNAIIGFSEVLSEKMFGELNEKQEEYLKDIHASGTHLLSLINDILDLSKIEAGRMELELTDFDLPTALENALMLVRERAGRRSIALHTTVEARLGQVRADERKVRQVVLNLLSNAIKFTPEGGRIDIRAVPKDGFVEVSVSDTGVGIAPEDQEAVFEEFRQVGTAAKKVEGTGLGLTLCRKFVELHGGRIWVKSELGAGSTFTFTLPVLRGE